METEASRTNSKQNETNTTKQNKATQNKTIRTKPNRTEQHQLKPNQTEQPNRTEPNRTEPNQTKPNQTKPNQTKPKIIVFVKSSNARSRNRHTNKCIDEKQATRRVHCRRRRTGCCTSWVGSNARDAHYHESEMIARSSSVV